MPKVIVWVSLPGASKSGNHKSFQIGTVRTLKGKVATEIWDEIKIWLHATIDESIPHNYFATGGNINKIQILII